MSDGQPAERYRFGLFEADASTGELRRQGVRVKLHAQPFQVLLLLLDRPGELLTREEIAGALWPEGTFVDYEHGVNSAVNRIREALGDTATSARFVETLARRGYRFVAPVERIGAPDGASRGDGARPDSAKASSAASTAANETPLSGSESLPATRRILTSPQDLPKVPWTVAQTLFVLLQLMYLSFYVGALTNLEEIQGLLAPLPRAGAIQMVLIVTAAALIPVRAFVLCAALFRAPRVREKILTLWRFLAPLDELWALSPFLLLHHINFGFALSCTALLAWAPFVQRSLVLMGAGGAAPGAPATMR
jgi:cholera toxin transcriptional activator